MSKMRSLFGVALALMVSACGQGANMTVEPSDELLDATQAAIEIWRPTLESCGRSLALSYDHADARIDFGFTGDDAALTYHDPLHVYLNKERLDGHPDATVRILAHELGHVMGAKDTEDPSDLMYILRGGSEPNQHDVEQVCGG
jgi:hypothetical protein